MSERVTRVTGGRVLYATKDIGDLNVFIAQESTLVTFRVRGAIYRVGSLSWGVRGRKLFRLAKALKRYAEQSGTITFWRAMRTDVVVQTSAVGGQPELFLVPEDDAARESWLAALASEGDGPDALGDFTPF